MAQPGRLERRGMGRRLPYLAVISSALAVDQTFFLPRFYQQDGRPVARIFIGRAAPAISIGPRRHGGISGATRCDAERNEFVEGVLVLLSARSGCDAVRYLAK